MIGVSFRIAMALISAGNHAGMKNAPGLICVWLKAVLCDFIFVFHHE